MQEGKDGGREEKRGYKKIKEMIYVHAVEG
jgi:hypothetical protein